jgi:hypothetical protein
VNKLIELFIPVLIILLHVALLGGSSEASVLIHPESVSERFDDHRPSQTKKIDDLIIIRGVLDARIENHRLRDKVMTKIAAMNSDERRLVTSLCRRISVTGDTTGANLAVFLVTALIVLS